MIIDSILEIGSTIIKSVFPNKVDQQKAQLQLFELQQNGELKDAEMRMNAIIADARSKDKWTSRARPTFLYVMYIMILSSMPMGIVFCLNPDIAKNFIDGVSLWFRSIPSSLWDMFIACYLGYGAFRSYDKGQILKGKG